MTMITKETHPEVFKKRDEAFQKAYRNHPNHGFQEGYIPTEVQMRAHGWTPENGWPAPDKKE